MADRTVTDTAGREWTCDIVPGVVTTGSHQGRDVVLACATSSVDAPVRITVGWQWEAMAPNGLARMISQASPVPRR